MLSDPAGGAGIQGLRVLTFTSLFPSVARPRHGIFVETRLRHLVRDAGVDARVVAPVPWFPLQSPAFGAYARYAATPRRTTRESGLQVSHPRYLMLPRLGVAFQPDSLARAAARDVAELQRVGWQPDIIDAHYFYPDGVAAALLAERLGVPLVITARGTDVNVLGRLPGPARRILWAARRAAAIIAVSTRLKEALVEIGVEESKVVVVRNGVDVELFRPQDKAAARGRLGLPPGRIAACVGNLVPEKGLALAIEALRRLQDFNLVIVGDGPSREELVQLARSLGVEQRVCFMSAMPQPELRSLYSSADVLLLTSTREGWPNVVLESLACGTPVVALDVGAVGEMITSPKVGRIVTARDAAELGAAVLDAVQSAGSPQQIHDHAAAFDWTSVSRAQIEVMARARRDFTAAAQREAPGQGAPV